MAGSCSQHPINDTHTHTHTHTRSASQRTRPLPGRRASRPAPGPCPPVQSPRDPRRNETSGSGGGRLAAPRAGRSVTNRPAARRLVNAQAKARGYIGRSCAALAYAPYDDPHAKKRERKPERVLGSGDAIGWG